MKISLNWLQDFVTLTETDPQAIGRKVTAGVAEVDDVTVRGALLEGSCVGKILTLEKHPNADRLSLCDVQTDDGVKKVVCGGSNLRVGMRVAFAHVGARVRWHGTEMMTLTKTTIRGKESEGMICTAEELDLQEQFPESKERTLIDLGDGNEDVGASLREFLGLSDTVLHIDNHAITHRPDLFSHIGFAREFVALGLAKWKKPAKRKPPVFPQISPPFACKIECPDLVPRYLACTLAIDSLGTTPVWMKRRLEATGWRSVSLPVDITNYVMMETGMPLHAFDAGDFRSDLTVRLSRKGDQIVTLDGQKSTLPDGCLVMNDAEGVFDLMGIMGGLRSSTKEQTRTIYLHAAILDPATVRRGVLATGNRTDAATVYEKGVPRASALIGLTRALELFFDLVPGARLSSELLSVGEDKTGTPIRLPLRQLSRLLGTDVSERDAVRVLTDLECDVTTEKAARAKKGVVGETGPSLLVTPPPHRLGDLKIPQDLIEEIGRVLGYDAIPPVMPVAVIDPPARDPRMGLLRENLRAERFVEILPISLIGPSLLRACKMNPEQCIAVGNPIGEEVSLLHPSTLPSLLAHAKRNLLEAGDTLRTFHWGKVFEKGKDEHLEMTVLLAQLTNSDASPLGDPLLLLKRDLGSILAPLGLSLEISSGESPPPYAHPGRYAELFLRPAAREKDGEAATALQKIGMLFEIHPDIRATFDLPHRAAAAVIDLGTLLSLPAQTPIARQVPHFPSVSYDVTLTLSHREQSGDMLTGLRGSDPLLESVDVTDLYAGKPLQPDQYNLTLRFTYRAPDRTLTEEEAKKAHENVLEKANA